MLYTSFAWTVDSNQMMSLQVQRIVNILWSIMIKWELKLRSLARIEERFTEGDSGESQSNTENEVLGLENFTPNVWTGAISCQIIFYLYSSNPSQFGFLNFEFEFGQSCLVLLCVQHITIYIIIILFFYFLYICGLSPIQL